MSNLKKYLNDLLVFYTEYFDPCRNIVSARGVLFFQEILEARRTDFSSPSSLGSFHVAERRCGIEAGSMSLPSRHRSREFTSHVRIRCAGRALS